jgi:hypothetical protein
MKLVGSSKKERRAGQGSQGAHGEALHHPAMRGHAPPLGMTGTLAPFSFFFFGLDKPF